MQGIYKITNITNNKCYIGKSNNIERRWQDHKRLAFLLNSKEYNKALYQAIRKYGIDNFNFEIIEELDNYDLSSEREIFWIAYYNSFKEGYNESLGGDGGSSIGHCQGEANGRAKLTLEDVKIIRAKYAEGCGKAECYELFKDKITLEGFAKVWLGRTWTHVMPEVFTENNKNRNQSIGRATGKRNRLYSEEEVKEIRKLKSLGEKNSEVFEKYKNKSSKSTFDDIWYERTYKGVK